VGGWICIAPESRIAQKISRGARRARRARREEWIRRQAADELRALCALCRITPSRPSCSSVVNLLLRSGRKSFPANPHESHSTRVLLHISLGVVAGVSSTPDQRISRQGAKLATRSAWTPSVTRQGGRIHTGSCNSPLHASTPGRLPTSPSELCVHAERVELCAKLPGFGIVSAV